MTRLAWNTVGAKEYESGLDRGVLFLPDSSGIAWNGLISVNEKSTVDVQPQYYDGRKFADAVTQGEYAATLSAYTYPDEFTEFEGVLELGNGVFLFNQRLKRFGLSYRTMIGNDIDGLEAGYKINILYNLLAKPLDTSFATLSDATDPVTFQWEITAVPTDLLNYEPTAKVVVDTRKSPSWMVQQIEDFLYGTSTTHPELPPLSYFLDLGNTDWS